MDTYQLAPGRIRVNSGRWRVEAGRKRPPPTHNLLIYKKKSKLSTRPKVFKALNQSSINPGRFETRIHQNSPERATIEVSSFFRSSRT